MKSSNPSWMKRNILALLAGTPKYQKNSSLNCSKMVQVLGCNPEVGTLTINDGDHFINVMLTSECIADITKDDVISNLKHTWIKIEIYHFSTVIQCVGSRDETRFASQAITFPLTIQCAKLQPLGAHDVEDFGQPIDLNKDPDVSNRLKGLTYIELTQMLGNRQFPDHKILPNSDGKFLTVSRMTDGDAENYEDYIIPLDQQLILDKLNMPLLTEQRANLNETLQPSLDSILVSAGKNFDRLADLQSTSNDHTLSDTLRDEVSPEESTQEATKYRRVQNLAETLVDDTQQDDADDDDFIDPSGGFELDVMRSTQTPSTQTTSTQITSPECAAHPSEGSVRRSKRNRVEETMPDESSPAAHMEASSSTHSSSPRKRTVTPSKAADDAYLTESSASKRRNLDTNWLTQPMTQDMQNELEDMDMDSHEDPVTQVSQALLSPSKSQGRVKDMRKIQNLGEKVAEDAQFDAAMIGRRIVKTFGRHGTFEGFVKHYCGEGRYLLMYDDGDTEEQYANKIVKMFLPKEEIVSGSRDEGQGDNSRRSPRTVKSPSAPSSSSSGRMDDEEAMAQASMMSARAAGDVFIRHVYDQDGVRQTLRGKDADPGLYETMLRLGYVDSDSDGDEDEEEADGDWEWSERKRLRQYKTVSCGFGPDGTVRRMPKEELKYSSAKLKALLESMISPRTNIPQQLITLNK